MDPRRVARNVPLAFAYALLMDFSLTAPIWVLYLRDERGFSMAQITFMEVPLFLLIVFAEVPTGAVADRYGRRISLLLASSILALSMYVYGVARDPALILVSNLTWALSFTLRSGADTALLYDSLKALGREAEFQRTFGRLTAVRSAAALGGLLLGAPLAAATSYSVAIEATAATAGVSLGAAWLMREVPREASSAAAELAPEGDYFGTLAAGAREVFDKPALRAQQRVDGRTLQADGACGSGPAPVPINHRQPPTVGASNSSRGTSFASRIAASFPSHSPRDRGLAPSARSWVGR